MKEFLYAISLICITVGCFLILYTTETRNFVGKLYREIDRKYLAAFEAIIGALLLFSATASHHSWFLRLIGLLAVIEGGVIFFLPKNLYDELIDWYVDSVSDQVYRLFGIISLVFGIVVLSWIY